VTAEFLQYVIKPKLLASLSDVRLRSKLLKSLNLPITATFETFHYKKHQGAGVMILLQRAESNCVNEDSYLHE
jgi:hypothetical protein